MTSPVPWSLGIANSGETARGSPAAASACRPAIWLMAGVLVCGFAVALALLSRQFGYDTDVADMPVLTMTGLLVVAGLLFATLLPRLITQAEAVDETNSKRILSVIIAAGLVARLVLFASQPMLEDDYQRYLWDGAVTASGINPYVASPRSVLEAGATSQLAALAEQSGPIVRRINHPQLTTIYPPVAQAAFAIAHQLSPWNLTAWRGVLLACDGLLLVLLLALLRDTNRSPLWASLYWWNPLVLKEGFNSAHMEPLVLALVMLTLWLVAKRKPVFATAALGLAVGTKLWPVLLLPLVLRSILNDTRRLAATVAVFAALMVLLALPIVSAGLNEHSGFLAYADSWKTNSALFPILEGAFASLMRAVSGADAHATIAVKIMLALALAALSVALAVRPIDDTRDVLIRASIVIAALVLLSPAQYPWYALWLAPLLAFWQNRAFLLLTATIPLYYASFYFAARETLEAAQPVLLAVIWVPVWLLAAYDGLQRPRLAIGIAKSAVGTPA